MQSIRLCALKALQTNTIASTQTPSYFYQGNLSYAGHNNQPRCPIFHKLCSRLSAPASSPSVCLGLQGQQQQNGGGCTEGKGGEAEGAALGCVSLEGLRGSLHRVESRLCGGTRTIIKDSTAASTWFACLIICHMLNITAISHIRALPLQRASLRLHESVGGSRPHGSFHADSPIEIVLRLQAYAAILNTAITIGIFLIRQNKTISFPQVEI